MKSSAPKKGGKSTKVKEVEPGPVDEEIAKLNTQVDFLESAIKVTTAKADQQLLIELEVRNQLAVEQEALKKYVLRNSATTYPRLQLNTRAIASDKTRLYKALQSDKIHQIDTMESAISDQKTEMEMCEHSIAESKKQNSESLQKTDNVLSDLQHKFDNLTSEFEHMITHLNNLLEENIKIAFRKPHLNYPHFFALSFSDTSAMSSGGNFTDFGELVLIIGDFHVPSKSSDIPSVFKELLNTDKIRTVLCTGNVCCNDIVDRLKSIAPNVHIVRGDMDTEPFPSSATLTVGHFKVGLIHGHQIVPWGDHDSLEGSLRKMDVDLLISGQTGKNEIFQSSTGKYFINPGSVTGADGNVPSFMLMAVQGPTAAIYVYELVDGKANVVMSDIRRG